MRTGHRLEDSRWAIPRQRNVPLTVAVKCEDVAQRVEREVVRVAESVSDDFAAGQVRFQPEDDSRLRLFDRRGCFRRVLIRDAGVVSRVEIPPAIGASLNGVNVVFAAGFEFEKTVRWPVGLPVAIGVSITQQRAVSRAEQILPQEEHALRAGFRAVSERRRRVRLSVAVRVPEGFYIAGTGNDHISRRVNRHREDVVSQFVVSKQRCREAIRKGYLPGRIGISRKNDQCLAGKTRQDQ